MTKPLKQLAIHSWKGPVATLFFRRNSVVDPAIQFHAQDIILRPIDWQMWSEIAWPLWSGIEWPLMTAGLHEESR